MYKCYKFVNCLESEANYVSRKKFSRRKLTLYNDMKGQCNVNFANVHR